MQPEVKKYLHDILTAIDEVTSFVNKAEFDDLLSNRMLQAAVEREFEIIGEALNRISKIDNTCLEAIQDVKRIIGFRNIIVHGYDMIDYEILWDAANDKVIQLKTDIQKLLRQKDADKIESGKG